MIFGNMQSYYRRNSIHNQSPSHGSQSKTSKEHVKRHRLLNKKEPEDEGDCDVNNRNRRRSFSISRTTDYDPPPESFNSAKIPVIKIGMYDAETSSKKSFNILKEKEKALWLNSSSDSDSTERLGPNKNNIIEESLQSDKALNGG